MKFLKKVLALLPTSICVLLMFATMAFAAQYGPDRWKLSGTEVRVKNVSVTDVCNYDGSNCLTLAGPMGDFVGPASSVDDNIVVFDGVTGKLGKDSGITAGIGTNTFTFTNGTASINVQPASVLSVTANATLDQDVSTLSAPSWAGASFIVPDGGNVVGVTATQNDITNNLAAFLITNTGSGNDITAPSYTLKAGASVGVSYGIGANILDTNEFSFLDGQDQAVAQASSPTFVRATLDEVLLDTSYTPGAEPEGLIWWNSTDGTLNISSDTGSVWQVNQEDVIPVYNNTGSQIDDGWAVHPVAGATAGRPHIEVAYGGTHVEFDRGVWLTTGDIAAGTNGYAIRFGKARGLNTSALTVGDNLWIAPSIATSVWHNLTNVQPAFPNYVIQIGGVAVDDGADGEIFVGIKGADAHETTINFWNGVFRETFDFRVTSNGSVITGALTPANGHEDMTMMFSDGMTMLDTTPAKTIALTAGADDNPQINYIYIPETTKVLTKSTGGFPATEHIKVAKLAVKTAATVQLEGTSRNQNVNDAIENTGTFLGHLNHMAERIRTLYAKHHSGTAGTATVVGGSEIYVSNTAGQVYQMHLQNFPVLDTTPYTIDAQSTASKTFTIADDGDLTTTFPDERLIQINDSSNNDGIFTVVSTLWSSPNFIITVEEAVDDSVLDGNIGDYIEVVNDFTTSYDTVASLADITTDASGGALNNTSYSVVMFGVMNKTGEVSHLAANFPSDTYLKNNPGLAVSDSFNRSVYTIPTIYDGVGFLIARFTFVNNAGTISLYDTEDLRGKIPNTTAGGGAGGTGVTEFTTLSDTPSAYTSQALKIAQVNVGETALEFTDSPIFGGNLEVTGNVGIGGTPTTALDVFVSSTNARIFGTGTAAQGHLSLRADSGQDVFMSFIEDSVGDRGGIGFATGSGSMLFKTGGDLTAATTALTLEDDQDAVFAGDIDGSAGTITGSTLTDGTASFTSGAMTGGTTGVFATSLTTALVTNAGALGFTATDSAMNITIGTGAADDFIINSSGLVYSGDVDNVSIGTAAPQANLGADNLQVEGGNLVIKETTTPTADANYGKIYTKTDNDIYFQDGAGNEKPLGAKHVIVRVLEAETVTATDTGVGGELRLPFAGTITAVTAYVDTAGDTSVTTMDINEAGTTILGTKLTIDANEKTSESAAAAATITAPDYADNAIITFDIDAISSGTAALGLSIGFTIIPTSN